MKRGEPPKRKKPLKPGKPLKAGEPIKRKKPMGASPPKVREKIRYVRKQRQRGVVKASRLEWDEIIAAKNGVCRVCGHPKVSYHHLLGGLRRDDVRENIIPLCGDGTTGCHGIYTSHWTSTSFDGRTRTWRQVACAIRIGLRPDEAAHIIGKVGEDGLERLYPLPVLESDLVRSA